MSFLVKQPSLPQSAGAADPKLSSGYKAAEVVPMGWGRDVYPSHWISGKYDEHSQSAGQSKPEWQYCSIAAVYCAGPVDFVGKVYASGKEIANLDYTFSVGEESHTFTLNAALASGRAWQAVVHRGTVDAATSVVTNLNAQTGQTHPPMRGYAWIEWLNIDLGQSTSLLSLAVELGTHAPAIGAFAAGDSHPYGVNPFAAVYALCAAAPAGDFDAALLDATHWGDQCNALQSTGVSGRTGNLTHCHPTFTASTSLGDAISQILAYVDGYVYAEGGKLKVGWFPSAAVDAGTLPEIAEGDLEAKPSGGGFPDWNEGATSVVVVFKSFDKDYGDDAARYNAPANRENNVTADPARKERHFIHSADQAAMMAADAASESSSGEITTNLTVFKSRAVDGTGALLMPGDLLNWDYAPHSLDLVCRLISRRLRMGVASDVLTVTRERGAFPRPYVAAVDARVLPTDDEPGEIDTGDVRIWQLPSGLASLREIAPLVNRTKRTIYRVDLHLSTDGSAPWENILDSRFFAAKGAVNNAGINSSVTTVRISSTSVDFARMTAQNAVGQADDALLLLVDDELMSVGSITTVSTGVYDLAITRGRRGTTAAAHSLAAVSWLFYRSEIDSVEHQEFYRVRDGSNVYNATIATKYFKLQLYTIGFDGLAKPDAGISLQLPDLAADDSQGYTIVLTNEAHTVACAADGTVNAGQLGAGGTARTTVAAFRGTTALTAVASGPNSDEFSIALGTLTNATATKETNDTARCDTLTADTGTIEITVSVAGAFTVTKVFTLTKAIRGVAGATGGAGLNAKLVKITSDAQVFQIAKDGTVTPATITFTASGQNLAGTPSWSNSGGVTSFTSVTPPYTYALPYANLTVDAVTVTATWDGQSDTITFVKVREGSDAIIGLLTNEAHNVPADAAGTVSSYAGAVTDMVVYRGAVDDTANWTFGASTTNITGSFGSGGTANRYTVSALSADVGYVDITASRSGFSSIVKRFTVAKSKTGVTGATGAVGPGSNYAGVYAGGTAYYQTAARRDIVSVGTDFYFTNNAAKNGLTTWGTPGSSGDWDGPYAGFRFTATDILLARDATITKTLIMGDGATTDAGLIRSAGASALMTGEGFWFNPRNAGGKAEFRIGDPAGSYLEYDGAKVIAAFGSGNTKTVAADTYFLWGKPDQTGNLFLCEVDGTGIGVTIQGAGGGYSIFGATDEAQLLMRGVAGGTARQLFFDTSTGELELGNSGKFSVGDVDWYRVSTNRWKTDDEVEIALALVNEAAATINSRVLCGPHAGAVQTAYALTVIHRHNSTGKYGGFFGTNWGAAESKIITAATVDATTGAVTERFNVLGDGTVQFGGHSAVGAETVTGYITIKDIAGNTRKIAVIS